MKQLALTGLVWLFCSSVASAEDYCSQLQGVLLEGQRISVEIEANGTAARVLEGRVLAVRPQVLALQVGQSRVYLNCRTVRAVTMTQTTQAIPGQGAPLADTINRVWKAFGE